MLEEKQQHVKRSIQYNAAIENFSEMGLLGLIYKTQQATHVFLCQDLGWNQQTQVND